jgi:hypothetical protein
MTNRLVGPNLSRFIQQTINILFFSLNTSHLTVDWLLIEFNDIFYTVTNLVKI